MRLLLLLPLLVLTGCGLLGGASTLTPAEVAGRYAFTEYEVEPTAGSLDGMDLRRSLGSDVTLRLTEDGVVTAERLRGAAPAETLASGTYSISGREVTLRWDDLGPLADLLMPRRIAFEGGGSRLRADVFLEAVDLESLSDDYDGLTRADVRLIVELREVGA